MAFSSSESAPVTTIAFGSEAFERLVRRAEKKTEEGKGLCILLAPAPAKQRQQAISAFAEDTSLNIHHFRASRLIRERFEQTQGNIREAFDTAGERAALLYFDEVDALFKRFGEKTRADETDVMPVDYLMQRVQNFRGVCLLSVSSEARLEKLIQKGPDAVVRFDE